MTTKKTGAAGDAIRLPSDQQDGPPWDHGENDPSGRPWWRHDLFPLETTPPEQVRRWYAHDKANAERGGAGHPEVLVVQRWNAEAAAWADLPARHPAAGRLALDTISHDALVARLGPGRYLLTAYAYVPNGEGKPRKLAAMRGRSIIIDADDEPAELETDESEEEEEEDDDEEHAADVAIERERIQLKARRLELDAEERRRRHAMEREDADRRERMEREDRRYREEREERERRDREERARWQEHQRAIAELYSRQAQPQAPANPIVDALMPILAQKAIAFIQGAGAGEQVSMVAQIGGKIAESVAEAIVPFGLVAMKKAGVPLSLLGYENPESSTETEEAPPDGTPE